MWRGLLAMQHAGEFEVIWEERTEGLGDDGVRREQIEQYDGIRGVLIPSIDNQKRNRDGYYVTDMAYFIVPYTELEERDIVPSTKTSYIISNGTTWRVTGFNNLSNIKQSHVYYVELEKAEAE